MSLVVIVDDGNTVALKGHVVVLSWPVTLSRLDFLWWNLPIEIGTQHPVNSTSSPSPLKRISSAAVLTSQSVFRLSETVRMMMTEIN